MPEETYSPGLAGVVAGETAVACVDQGELLYRGYAIAELAEKCSFEEVAHLLIYGMLPDRLQMDVIHGYFDTYRPLAPELEAMLRKIPREVPMMDVLRSCVSYAGHFDPIAGESPEHLRQRSIWLVGQIAAIIAARYRLLNGHEPVPAACGMSHAPHLLYQATGEIPDPQSARLLDLTLVLYAEHTFNASTFACRVIASTESDMVSAVVGAIGALKGPLHGGANEKAMEMLERFDSADAARKWVHDALERKEKIMGFGHRVYKHGDHRAHILEEEVRRLAAQKGQQKWMDIYDAIKGPMVNEKGIHPNVDYPCGLAYYLLGLPLDLYTPLFVAARITGWCAHYIEQMMDNKLYRPLSNYTGEARRPVPPLDAR